MSQNPGLAIGKDQRQFVREPLPVMQGLCAVFFLFPMIGELYRAPPAVAAQPLREGE
jgi:hypothetical protein